MSRLSGSNGTAKDLKYPTSNFTPATLSLTQNTNISETIVLRTFSTEIFPLFCTENSLNPKKYLFNRKNV